MEWINIQLAQRFGVADKFSPLLLNALNDEGTWDTAMDKIMQTGYETWMKNATIAPMNPPSYADFKKSPIFYAPRPPSTLHAGWQEQIQKVKASKPSRVRLNSTATSSQAETYPAKSFSLPKRGDQYMCFGGSNPPKIPPIAQWVTPINNNIGRDGAKYPLTVLTWWTTTLSQPPRPRLQYVCAG